MMKHTFKGHCIIVTRFTEGQPGYLDFAYRVRALAREYRTTLISEYHINVPEMEFSNVDHVVLSGGARRFGQIRYLCRAARYIRRMQPDCVLLLHTMTAPLVYLLGDIRNGLYWNEHASRVLGEDRGKLLGRIYRRLKYRCLFIEAMKRVDLVMPIGEAHRDDLLAQGCKPERVRMIYMGVDKKFSGVALGGRRRNANSPLELIYTGSVQKERGRDIMIEGVAKALAAGVPARLTIVGAQQKEIARCEAYARACGVGREIVVRGRVPGFEIPRFIAEADAGICLWEDRPWWRFNPPTKLFEYLVAGLPVLASNIRTHTEYIRHGHNGLIFEYNSSSLSLAISDLWKRRSNLMAMKRCAFESGRPYVWDNIEPIFLDAVASLIQR